MYNLLEADIDFLVVHQVGNRFRNEGFKKSNECLNIKENIDLMQAMGHYFFSSFQNNILSLYRFIHENELAFNEIFMYSVELFDCSEEQKFTRISHKMLEHLYKTSEHPSIKSGELYISKFSNCIFEGERIEAIGIFKSELKDIYIKVNDNDKRLELECDSGININSLDKGCIIFRTQKNDGYRMLIVDKQSKKNPAKYWKDNFLGVNIVVNSKIQTEKIIKVISDFEKKNLPIEKTTEKERIKIAQNISKYFDENDKFKLEQFSSQVFSKPEIRDDFNNYVENNVSDILSSSEFKISKDSISKSKRIHKRKIKLTKGVEVLIELENIGERVSIQDKFDRENNERNFIITIKN